MPLKKNIIVTFLFFYSLVLFAQNHRIDSLNNVLLTCKEDTNKVKTLNTLSNSFFNAEKPLLALQTGRAADTLAKKLKYTLGDAYALLYISRAYWGMSIYPTAISFGFEAVKFFKKTKDENGLVNATSSFASIYSAQGDYVNALAYYQKALALAEEVSDRDVVELLYSNIALEYANEGDYSRAVIVGTAALNQLQKLTNKYYMAIASENMGYTYYLQHDTLNSVMYAANALRFYEQFHAYKKMSSVFNLMGDAYSLTRDSVKTYDYMAKALQIQSDSGYKYEESHTMIDLGSFYLRHKDTIKAFAYYTNGLRLYNDLSYPEGIALADNLLGHIYSDNLDSANTMKYYSEARNLQERNEIKSGMAITLNNIGDFYFNYTTKTLPLTYYYSIAVDSIIKAYNIFDNDGDERKAAKAASAVGDISIIKGDPIRAGRYLLRALKVEKKFDMKRDMVFTLYKLSDAYAMQGLSKGGDYSYQARLIEQDSSFRKNIGQTYNYIITMYLQIGHGRYDLENCLKTGKLADSMNDAYTGSIVYTDIGYLYYIKGDTANAILNYALAEVKGQASQNDNQIAISLNRLSKILFLRKEYAKAEQYYLVCLNYSKKAYEANLMMDCYYNLYNIYLVTNQAEPAKNAYARYREVSDLIRKHK